MILAQMPSMVQVDLVNSTAMELHSDLAGLYHPKGENVYKKVDRHTGRSQYLFIREGDWIVGYSTITHPVLEVSLYYTIPGLLQKIIPDSSEPSKQGWMYLSKSKTWTLDARITVTSYWARERPGDLPCEVVTGLDYPGQDIHQSWTEDIRSCVEACKDMVVCRGITFRDQECRLKHSMVESVNIKTGSLQSVQLA